jgi:succinate dehydrogenase/fumarate reductase flavoprotein subunit
VIIETSVLVIGAGAAGLRTAIELVGAGVDCLVVGKRRHGDAHTRMAAGGINASLGSLDPEDRWEIHAADTIREGGFVCQPRGNHAGIVRSEDGLRAGLSDLEGIAHDARHVPAAPELRFALLAAEAILRSALMRDESRGAHFREDASETRDEWHRNIVCARGRGGRMSLRAEPVPPVPRGVQRALDEHHALDYHHLE